MRPTQPLTGLSARIGANEAGLENTAHMGTTGLKAALASGVKSKVAVAVLTALLATGSATGAAAAANNGAFGQQVKAQVAACKAHLGTGVHGIGECVSDFAQQHGKSDSTHGKSNSTHGHSGSTHGNSGSTHGKSGSTHGNSGSH